MALSVWGERFFLNEDQVDQLESVPNDQYLDAQVEQAAEDWHQAAKQRLQHNLARAKLSAHLQKLKSDLAAVNEASVGVLQRELREIEQAAAQATICATEALNFSKKLLGQQLRNMARCLEQSPDLMAVGWTQHGSESRSIYLELEHTLELSVQQESFHRQFALQVLAQQEFWRLLWLDPRTMNVRDNGAVMHLRLSRQGVCIKPRQ